MGRKLISGLRWLLPDIALRKWLALLILMSAAVSAQFVLLGARKLSFLFFLLFVMPCLILLCYSYYRVIMYVYQKLRDNESSEIAKFHPARRFDFDPKLVVIGGGTGLATLLRGIKKYARLYDEQNVTAVVTVMDDGGSSGRLRKELNILPPGDIRNCLVSLAREEGLMSDLFKYRFPGKGELSGHSFGNLFIAALTEVTGDFEKAIEESTKILAVKGSILPATLSSHTLVAELSDGSTARGESAVGETPGKEIRSLSLDPEGTVINRNVLAAISEADCIILGPGSLFTSVIPNLLVPEIRETLKQSKALKIYICNIMTQPHETDGFSASEHVRTVLSHMDGAGLDYAIINSARGSAPILERYKAQGSLPVRVDLEELKSLDIGVVLDDLMEETDYLRHNFRKLARLIVNIIVKHIYEKE